MFFVQEGFTYRNFLMDIIAVFTFVVWFWLIIVIYGDLFRRHDISGWGKRSGCWRWFCSLTSASLLTWSPKAKAWPNGTLSRLNRHATNSAASSALVSQTKLQSSIS
jgi:hypothetical protein